MLISMKQLILLITLWCGIFCNYVCYSIIAPFFPQLAKQKNLSAEDYSIVFGCYSLAQITFSCIVGKFLQQIGVKFVVVAGLFVTGGATILFGCIENAPAGAPFFWLAVVIRVVEGAGFAAYLTSVLTVVVETFPQDPGYYVGLTETVVTVGMILGPPLGSFLYTIGGYHTPFIVFGTIICATAVVAIFTVKLDMVDSYSRPRMTPKPITTAEYMSVLRLTATMLTILAVTLNVVADSFIMITLSSHLQQFSLTIMEIGSIYLFLFLAYGISSPLAGRLADRFGCEFLLQTWGSLILVAAFSLIGPATYMPFGPEIWIIVIALLLKGVGAGPLICCSYSACLRAAKLEADMPDDFRTYSLVSTIVSFSIPLGNLIGGFTAGVMLERLGMDVSTTIYANIFLGLAVLCLMQHIKEKSRIIRLRRRRYNNKCTFTRSKPNNNQSEATPILCDCGEPYGHEAQNGGFRSSNGSLSSQVTLPLSTKSSSTHSKSYKTLEDGLFDYNTA